MNLYLVAVLLQPTKKQRDDEGLGPELIVPATSVLAKDPQQMAMQITPLLPEKYKSVPLERLEVLYLPFQRASNSR